MTFTDDLTFIPRAEDGIAVVTSGGIVNGDLCVWGMVEMRKRASSGLLEASKALNMTRLLKFRGRE
jgi:hypothetical protein